MSFDVRGAEPPLTRCGEDLLESVGLQVLRTGRRRSSSCSRAIRAAAKNIECLAYAKQREDLQDGEIHRIITL
eukprot:CAMPEP_0204156952 /NCGR_PEP_ID=MMETSP0361-20130328/30856_1 /ASSEMBLY_ACC=CAM_ASM_000343 /TAXON_ID=268821 /ORGANISM="Scrippsiella Hangoei, Strain SHTV-5" /LENGTH=72 /DNA_ID=CAMNT_0051112663 /DNA_START=18 /DNA_END=236 /DNA_ORIENTATION=-